MGAALSGMGHEITLAYLPYASLNRQTNRFDVRRHNAYTHSALKESAGLFQTVSLLDVRPASEESLPGGAARQRSSRSACAIHNIPCRSKKWTGMIRSPRLPGYTACAINATWRQPWPSWAGSRL